jgi:hypothetical protein
MATLKAPFCAGDRDAELAFSAWLKRVEALGIEVGDADLYVIGVLASREAALERLRRAVVKKKLNVGLVAAERLAASAFTRALEQAERVFGSRVVATPAAGGGAGKVVAMELPRGVKGPVAVAQRIKFALVTGALTKAELGARVQGDTTTFFAQLRALVKSGEIVRDGQGTKGSPFRYRRAG